jgi:hypothetical protein
MPSVTWLTVLRAAINNKVKEPTMKSLFTAILDGLTFKDIAGKRQPRAYTVLTGLLLFLILVLASCVALERQAMLEEVQGAPQPVQVTLEPTEVAQTEEPVVETLLTQGKPLNDALDEAVQAVGPDGRMVLSDLVVRLRSAPADEAAQAVRAWTTAWDNPAVDIVATSLLASIEGRIEIGPLVAALRRTLGAVVEVLSRARAAARGVEWQARFLALFPLYALFDWVNSKSALPASFQVEMDVPPKAKLATSDEVTGSSQP